jgi:adenosylcobyric acid synthase
MLGKTIADPDGIEGEPATVPGLGLLDVETVLTADKRMVEVTGTCDRDAAPLAGYEIHVGRTSGADCGRPFARIRARGEGGDGQPHPDGAVSANGRVVGTYVHGLFTDDRFRAAFLKGLGAASELAYESEIDATLDRLAAHLEAALDIDALLAIARAR